MGRRFIPYSKGVAVLATIMLLFYPLVLLARVLLGSVPRRLDLTAVLLILSLFAWLWAIQLYRRIKPGIV